jgi:hypothetical protein
VSLDGPITLGAGVLGAVIAVLAVVLTDRRN